MLIVKIMGGLGNQMFQYALYKRLLCLGRNTKIDTKMYDELAMHNGFELYEIFDIQPEIAALQEVNRIGDTKRDFISKVRRKLGFRKSSHYTQKSEEVAMFFPKVFDMENAYLDGYWQSEKYFKDIEQIIRKDFVFKKALDSRNENIAQEMKECESVSLHIRRGDYLQIPLFQNICTQEYYEKSMDYITKKVQKPRYYIFSNDIQWCRDNLSIEGATFIDWNNGEDSFIDMQLMSSCKHNIIANSSFSWWGAWLNSNPDKIVVSPNKWFNDVSFSQGDIIPEEWIKIGV